jgi:hypothetical protein
VRLLSPVVAYSGPTGKKKGANDADRSGSVMPTKVGIYAFSAAFTAPKGLDGLPSQAMTVREQPIRAVTNLAPSTRPSQQDVRRQ